jgi:Domain of unknown function (DUF4129)
MFWKRKHIIQLFIAVLLAAAPGAVLAQPEPEEVTVDVPAEVNENDESYTSYDKRYYDRFRLQELKKQREFQYDSVDDKNAERLREISDREYMADSSKWKNRNNGGNGSQNGSGNDTRRSEQKNKSTSVHSGGSGNWLLILLLFLALVVILMVALKLKPGSLFSRRGAKDIAEHETTVENIHTMKFESELEKAIRLKNFRLALRIMYLETLKKMTDQNVIHWQPEKTNWDYVREVKDAGLRAPFTEITNAYDYAWYGEFAIDEPLFRMMQDKMTRFRQKM